MLCMLEDFLPLFKIIGLEPKHLKMQKEQVTAAAPVPCLLPTGSRCGRQGDCMRAGQRVFKHAKGIILLFSGTTEMTFPISGRGEWEFMV